MPNAPIASNLSASCTLYMNNMKHSEFVQIFTRTNVVRDMSRARWFAAQPLFA